MTHRVLLASMLLLVGPLALAACSGGRAADDDAGDGVPSPDGGSDRFVPPQPANFQTTFVLVNALTTDTIGDVRICPKDSSALAVPNDRPMALTNFPGVARGRGQDLGAFEVGGGIDVFSAMAIQQDVKKNCGDLRSERPFTHLAVPATPAGPSALILVDDPNGVVSVKRVALQAGMPPTPEAIAGQFAFAGTGVQSGSLTLTFGATKAQSGTAASSPAFLLPRVYDDEALVSDDSKTFTYKQSLRSIQYVSDPTTEPVGFYDARTQFLFVLVGSPTEKYETYKTPDKLTGAELHIAAVPFTLMPQGNP